MKRIISLIVCLMGCVPTFAQWEERAVQVTTGKAGSEIAVRANETAAQQLTRATDQLSKSIENALHTAQAEELRMQGLRVELENGVGKSPQTDLWRIAQDPQSATAEVLQGRLPQFSELHAKLFPDPSQMYVPLALLKHRSFSVYRGMKLKPQEIKNILINGLEINKGEFVGEVFTSPSIRMALSYAVPDKYFVTHKGAELDIPVLVKIRLTEELLSKIPFADRSMELIFQRTVPASYLTDVMVFLDINGKQDWYKVVLKDEKLFLSPTVSQLMPADYFASPRRILQTRQTDKSATQPTPDTEKQTRLSDNKLTQQLVPLQIADVSSALPTKLAVLPESVASKEIATGTFLRSTYMRYQEQDKALDMYLTHKSQAENTEFFYRGMHVDDLNDVLHILRNGLPVKQKGYNMVYVSSSPAVAKHYAKLEEGIPVLVVMKKADVAGSLRSGRISEYYAEKDIPAEFLSEVFVLLDINGKPGWYKVALKDGELVFTAAPNQYVKVDNFVEPGQEFQPKEKAGTPTAISISPSEQAVSSAASDFRVLPDAQLRNAISNDDQMRLFVPETFVQADNILYRGLRLKNTAELQNILERGMEVGKTHHEMIYVSPNVSVAMGYMFPSQTARLLGTHEGEVALPVLVKIPVTERLLEENPPQKPQEEFGGRRVLYNDISADMVSEVAVYADINGKPGWYKVTLKNGNLVFAPSSVKTIGGWIAQ